MSVLPKLTMNESTDITPKPKTKFFLSMFDKITRITQPLVALALLVLGAILITIGTSLIWSPALGILVLGLIIFILGVAFSLSE